MQTTIKDLKDAFISFQGKMNGMPIGRTAFQDFEIAQFLNAAYDKCVAARVKELNQGFEHIDTQMPNKERRDVHNGHILSELGSLYRASIHEQELSAAGMIDEDRFRLWGPLSHMFEVHRINGTIPYILSVDLCEAPVYGSPNDKARHNVTIPVRILTGGDQLRLSLMMQGGIESDRLPYRYGRLHAMSVRSWTDMAEDVAANLKSLIGKIFGSGGGEEEDRAQYYQITKDAGIARIWVIDLIHKLRIAGDELWCSMEVVAQPQPILESELATDSERLLEAAFGYEVAEVAADMASKALTSGGAKPQPQI